MSKKEIKTVNQSLGQPASVGIFSGIQFVIALLSFGAGFIVCYIFGIPILWCILIGLWMTATVITLSGKRPYLFWSRVFPSVPQWSRGYVKYSSPQQKNRVGSKKIHKSW